jgi:chromosome partitioning protein
LATLTVFNARDGVGKTTTSARLLAALARRGTRPLGVDLAPDGALTRAFGVDDVPAPESSWACVAESAQLVDVARVTASGVIVCPAHPDLDRVERVTGKGPRALGRLARALADPALRGGTTVIDCAATFGVPTLNALFAADLLLVPVSPDYLAVEAAQRVERAVKALEPVMKRTLPRRYLLTRVVPGAQVTADIDALTAIAFGPEVLGTRVREATDVAQAGTTRADPDAQLFRDYEALLDELTAVLPGLRVPGASAAST